MLRLNALLGDAWERRPVHVRGGGAPVRQRLGAAQLREAVASGQVPDANLSLRGFLGPVPRDAWAGDRARATALAWDEGHALVINGAHTCVPALQTLAAALEQQVGGMVRSNAYRTVQGTFAYPLHWDTHSLVAVQLEGRKRWELFAPVHALPIPGHRMGTVDAPRVDAGAPTWVVELEPGDLLYVPRGWGHRVCTTGDESVHVTFGFHLWSRHDALAVAAERALLRLEGRQDLRAHLDGSEAVDVLADLVQAAVRTELAQVVDEQAAHRARIQCPEADTAGFELAVRHLHLIPDPVRGCVRVRLGTPRQDAVDELRVGPEEGCLLGLLQAGRQSLSGLTAASGLGVEAVAAALEGLRAAGLVRAQPPRVVRSGRPADPGCAPGL